MPSSIQGNSVSFWLVEATGTPTTPAWSNIRRSSGDIDLTKSFTQSEEVDVTRQPGYNIITGSEISGSIDTELAVDDPALVTLAKSALQNTVGGNVSANGSATFTSGANTIELTGAFANAVAGQYIGVFGSTSNDGIKRIVSVTDNDTVVVSPALTTEDPVTVDVSGQSIRNSNTESHLAVQKRIPTDSGTIYKTFEDCQVSTLEMSISAESIVTLSFGMTGLTKTDGIAQIADSTDNAVNTSRVSGTVKDVAAFWIDGTRTTPSSVCYTDFSVSLDNGAQGNPAIGKEGACSISFGAANVSGSLVSYVDGTDTTTANSEVAKRDAETLFGLAVELKDVDGNYLVVNLPSVQYTELTQDETANGDILKNNGSYAANGKEAGYAIELNFISAP